MRARGVLVGVVVLAVAVVVGLVVVLIPDSDSDSGERSEDLADSPCPIDRHARQVRKPSYFTEQARPYAGPGPHRMQVMWVNYTAGPGRGEANEAQAVPDVPTDWQSFDGPRGAQLVLCKYVSEGKPVKDCAYSDSIGPLGTTKLVRATYRYQLYEGRTSRLLTRFEVAGTGDCLPTVPTSGRVLPKTVPQEVDDDTVTRILRPFVEQRR